MRDRIINAAQEVIIREGVNGTTARKIAAQAGISPGTLTWHFKAVDEVLEAAFIRLADEVSVSFRQRLQAAADRQQAIEAVVDLICGEIVAAPRNMLLSFELYAFASRNARIREISRAWMARSRDSLALHFDIRMAIAIDALIEGFTVHQHLSDRSLNRDELREVLCRITAC